MEKNCDGSQGIVSSNLLTVSFCRWYRYRATAILNYFLLDRLVIIRIFCAFSFVFFAFLEPGIAANLSELQVKLGPRPVDGVYVETVQSYLNPKQHQVGFDFGLWPVQPYYNGFSLDAYYSYYLDKDRAWEVINLSYLYTVDTGLTAELADLYQVRPSTIERLKYVISSNYVWSLVYGKYIFLDKNIRYFRSSILAGPALIVTTQASIVGVCLGWSLETFVNEKTSWKFQVRDNLAFGNSHPHNLVFLVGTSYGF